MIKQNTYIMIRILKEEKTQAKLKAKNRGLNLSKYLRYLIKKDRIRRNNI